MSFQLDRGLFQFDFTDRHAILGVGVNAEEVDIRDRYMTVARLLHPDSARWKTDVDRQLSVQLFSRLIVHAYGTLSKVSQREEQVRNILIDQYYNDHEGFINDFFEKKSCESGCLS